MRVGFTGTRQPLTNDQQASLVAVISDYGFGDDLHHGDCVGADAAAHRQAERWGLKTILHPPTNDRYRAHCVADEEREPKPYIERNHDIVDECDVLIACPGENYEVMRSGTWATVRYARLADKPITYIFPDGGVVV